MHFLCAIRLTFFFYSTTANGYTIEHTSTCSKREERDHQSPSNMLAAKQRGNRLLTQDDTAHDDTRDPPPPPMPEASRRLCTPVAAVGTAIDACPGTRTSGPSGRPSKRSGHLGHLYSRRACGWQGAFCGGGGAFSFAGVEKKQKHLTMPCEREPRAHSVVSNGSNNFTMRRHFLFLS